MPLGFSMTSTHHWPRKKHQWTTQLNGQATSDSCQPPPATLVTPLGCTLTSRTPFAEVVNQSAGSSSSSTPAGGENVEPDVKCLPLDCTPEACHIALADLDRSSAGSPIPRSVQLLKCRVRRARLIVLASQKLPSRQERMTRGQTWPNARSAVEP
jgi:hypothetical protein